jgi:predicted cobalt transporter CbtA
MTNLPNPYFHTPATRYPTQPPGPRPAWATAPQNEEPDKPAKKQRSKAKTVTGLVSAAAGIALAIVAFVR